MEMAEHNRVNQNGQGKADLELHISQKESETLFDRIYVGELVTSSDGETPFLPRLDTHTELLAQARSDKMVQRMVSELHKTYGNRYVQRLLNSNLLQTKLIGGNLKNVYEWKSDTTQRALQIARTPASTPSEGTIAIGRVSDTHYDVNGNTLEEVSEQLDPEEWGRCTWTWNQSYRITEGAADRININLGLSIRMPRWRDRG
jgi:hypothetical protein